MKAPISVCIIVKNDPSLEKCIQSFKDYVEEVIVVDTGSTDGITQEIGRKYANIFKIYTDCNNPETGLIEDFSQARNYSFSLATQHYILWIDSDDIIAGAENFHKLIQEAEVNRINFDGVAYLFPYEYAYTPEGKCILRHYRERLILNKNLFHFVNPVHECLIPKGSFKIAFIQKDDIIFKHQRQYSTTKQMESGRNLRILKKYYEKVGDSDARQLYYLGLECCNNGLIDEAIKHLSKYTEISGWGEEIVQAQLKLVEIYLKLNQLDNAMNWALKTISIKENWAECYFAIGKVFYFKAMLGGPNEMDYWHKSVHFFREGLKLPPTQTLLFINPMEREFEIYKYLNFALTKTGDIKEALNTAKQALKAQPNDELLISNKNIIESFLARNSIIENGIILKNNNAINDKDLENIGAIINNQPILNILSEKWRIPSDHDLNELPLNLSSQQFESVVMMMWKQFMLYDDAKPAKEFLRTIKYHKLNSNNQNIDLSLIDKMLKLTDDFLEKKTINLNEDKKESIVIPADGSKLDIIFMAGNGVEIWNGQTIKETGIGGSELLLYEISKRLAALGHKVRVFNSCGAKNIYDNVIYDLTENYHNLECDVLIVSRRADYLADKFNIKAKLKLLWVHDVCAINATNELLLKADRILALSQWHKRNILQVHSVNEKQIIVTRNGIDVKLFEQNIKRNKFKCINASSPDRSWPILLNNIWPRVKEKLPNAELHLYYGFFNWKFAAQNDKLQMDLINRLEKQIEEMKSLDVVYHGRINQQELALEFLSSGALLHPTWFTETFGITFANAQAAGLRIITSSIAALNEVVGERGILIDGAWTDKIYQDKFVEATVKSLTKEDDSDRFISQQYAKEHFGLDELTKEWQQMFFYLLKEKQFNPLIPYQPTKGY